MCLFFVFTILQTSFIYLRFLKKAYSQLEALKCKNIAPDLDYNATYWRILAQLSGGSEAKCVTFCLPEPFERLRKRGGILMCQGQNDQEDPKVKLKSLECFKIQQVLEAPEAEMSTFLNLHV